MGDFSVMIVDDGEADRYILKRLLTQAGFLGPIIEKADGWQAIEFIRSCGGGVSGESASMLPAIVFLDINMPRMNGFEFLKAFEEMIGEFAGLDGMAFLMLSSSMESCDREAASGYSFVKGYIVKMPPNGDALLSHIREFVPWLAPAAGV